MKATSLNNEELRLYFLEHVRYEVQLLMNAVIAIDQKMQVPTGLECMIVESFSIHLRNLITFLYPYTFRSNDVCAKNFFLRAGTWEGVRPELSNTLKQAKTRADVEVGHLTTLRKNGTPDNKTWDVKGLAMEIFPIFKLFCESADKVSLYSDIAKLQSHYLYMTKLQSKYE